MSLMRLKLLITVTLGQITENWVTWSSSRRWGHTITQDFNPSQYISGIIRGSFCLKHSFTCMCSLQSWCLCPIAFPTPCRLCECMVVCLVLTKTRMGLVICLEDHPLYLQFHPWLVCTACVSVEWFPSHL